MNRLDQRVNVVPPFFSIVLQDGEVGEKLHVGVFLVDALGGPSSSHEGVIGRSERAFEIAAQAALGILKSLTINRARPRPSALKAASRSRRINCRTDPPLSFTN